MIDMVKSLWSKVIQDAQPEVMREDVNIAEWKRIYQGKSDWLDYQEVNVDGVTRKRTMKTMNSAKLLCQKMATLIYSEEPNISGPDALLAVLEDNKFLVNQPEDIERGIALGAQIVKQRVKNGKIKYDYITADNFVPLTWDNSGIYEAAFLDHRVIKGKEYVRVETHKHYYPDVFVDDGEGKPLLDDNDRPIMQRSEEPIGYEIRNELFRVDQDKMTKVDISGLMPDIIDYQVVEVLTPLFAYCKNPIANNQNSTTPVGMSIYGNAKDTLEALELAFNNMAEAPELCKPRIMVSDKLTRVTYDSQTGNKKRIFDTQDRVYRTAPMTDDEKQPIQDLTIPLQHDPIRRQIQTLLDI
ncbi:MAG: phage portal protein, partial [Sphaerochaetaceae bacterium]